MKIIKELIEDFINYPDLNYYETGTDYIDLFIRDKFLCHIYVWLDTDMDDREYILINNGIIHLDTIQCLNPEDLVNKE